jgi:hypothetical protein
MPFSYSFAAHNTNEYTFTIYEEIEAEAMLYACEIAEAIKLRNADM